MRIVELASMILSGIASILTIRSFYKRNEMKVKLFFNNRKMDAFQVVMTGLLSICYVILGYITIWTSDRPFDYYHLIAIVAVNVVAGVFFIVSCNLWEAIIIPENKIKKE